MTTPPPFPATEKSAPAAAVADAARAQAEADAQRLRSDAEAIKRQAEADLARARSDAEAGKAARTKAEGIAAAARVRAEAEADATRIRAEAEAAAARTRSDAEAAARAAEIQVAKTKEAQRQTDAKAAAASAAATGAADKAAPALANANRFDGTWNVTVDCVKHTDGAFGYTYDMVAQVKDGYLQGQHLAEGAQGSMRLEGRIQPDGRATLEAKGTTGDSKFLMKGGRPGTAYAYTVQARFEGSRGMGRRVQLRACTLNFARQ